MGKTMITRQQYMNGECTHDEYYSDVLSDLNFQPLSDKEKERYRAALKKDKHLNTIPLASWDGMAALRREIITNALKARGDFWSLAGGVCVMKQFVKNQCNET